MRLQEFLSADELQQFDQLIYDNVYRALATYQQQQRLAVIQRQQDNTSTVKPKATKRQRELANKVKRTPHVATPKPLPQPKLQAPPQPSAPKSYNPIKAPKPLPALTRAAIKQPTTAQQGETVKNNGDLDQRARSMLPKHQRNTPIWDLINSQ